MLNPNAKRYANSPSPRLMKLSKKRKRKHLANAFSGRAWKFHTSGNNGNRRNKPWMRYILLLRSINDLQVKKNRIQYNNHMDPKKNCIFVNPLSANPTKWSNTLKQFVGPCFCRLIFWVCLTILWGWDWKCS